MTYTIIYLNWNLKPTYCGENLKSILFLMNAF